MSTYQVNVSAMIDAPASDIYSLLADYHEGHRAILPARYFTEMTVTQGGYGAGTAVTVHMNVFGAKVIYHLEVTEPEPGRVLQEEDVKLGIVTTFTVEPINDTQSQVTIVTTASASSGLKGWLEKLMNPAITRRIYREELAQLQAVIQKRAGARL